MPGTHRRDEERLSVGQAAEELGISERSTRRLIDRGELVAYRPTPRKIWILGEDLRAFLESRRTSTASKREAG